MNIFNLIDLLKTQNETMKDSHFQVDKKQCYIYTFSYGGVIQYMALMSYDRIVAIYNSNTQKMVVECDTIKNNKAKGSFSVTTTKHINMFLDMIDWVYLDNLVNFDYYCNLERQRLIDRIEG